ncbi:PIN domain-containing protein [Candidatus Margulisiibacteriota bacterium]
MKALDTNILVRFLVNDNKTQSLLVRDLFQKAEEINSVFYIPINIILELHAVLKSIYKYPRNKIILAIEALSLMNIFIFENIQVLRNSIIKANASNYDFPDLLIGYNAKLNNCLTTLTFDKKAAKSDLFELLK